MQAHSQVRDFVWVKILIQFTGIVFLMEIIIRKSRKTTQWDLIAYVWRSEVYLQISKSKAVF